MPPGDPRALRQAIEHLLQHPEEAARMGRAGRELVETRHTLDRYVERVVRIVRESGDRRNGQATPTPSMMSAGEA